MGSIQADGPVGARPFNSDLPLPLGVVSLPNFAKSAAAQNSLKVISVDELAYFGAGRGSH